jgi:hypothetical protein
MEILSWLLDEVDGEVLSAVMRCPVCPPKVVVRTRESGEVLLFNMTP